MLAHQLAHRMPARRRAPLGQTTADLAARQVGPQHAFPHRIARGEFSKNLEEVSLQQRLPCHRRFATPAYFSDSVRCRIVPQCQFHQAPPHSLRIEVEQPRNVVDAAMPQLRCLNPRVAPPILLRQHRVQPLHLEFDLSRLNDHPLSLLAVDHLVHYPSAALGSPTPPGKLFSAKS